MDLENASGDTASGSTSDSLSMEFCALLERWGVKARIKDRAEGAKLRAISGHGPTFSIIEIDEGPVSQISIRWETKTKLVRDALGNIPDESYNPSDYVPCAVEYGIPDQRLKTNIAGALLPQLRIRLAQVRFLPLLGKITNVRWKGNDFGMGVIAWLNRDISLKKSLVNSPELEINADYYHNCWIMSVKAGTLPSKELWDCYQSVARHLLAGWQ